jgi:transglutaminase-like putative cysteine protease
LQYTIRHVTKFTYEVPISESVMEVRMQPRTEAAQRCIRFGLSTAPGSHVRMYQDHAGNTVHHFNIPGPHSQLTVTAEGLVECAAPADQPATLEAAGWVPLDALTASGEFWDALNPSPFAHGTPLLDRLAEEIGLVRGDDPLGTVRRLMTEIYSRFEYSPHTTRVDSPIDDALETRQGVCQDFAHIMIALVRQLGVPCRYVSGYLCHQAESAIRSSDGATHAWIEAWFPALGWVGLDPTNNLMAGDRHIRVAVGRDYADVPPTRGVFKGSSAIRSELAVAVRIGSLNGSAGDDAIPFVPWMSREAASPLGELEASQQQQQQQQQ